MRISRACMAAAAMLVLAAAACGRGVRPAPGTGGATIVVENGFGDELELFVVSDGGSRTRLRPVAGSSTTTVPLPRSYIPIGRLRLLATQLAGGGGALSQPLNVFAGDTVVFIIDSNLGASRAYVR